MPKTVDHVNKVGAAPEDVLEAVHGLMHLYRAQLSRALRDAQQPVSPLEGRVLGFLARHPGASQSDLVARSGRDKGQLARLVAGLRECGLLEARADAADRRSQRLHLTPAGQDAQLALRRQGRRLATAAVKGLSEAERQQLLGLLGRVRGNLEQAGE